MRRHSKTMQEIRPDDEYRAVHQLYTNSGQTGVEICRIKQNSLKLFIFENCDFCWYNRLCRLMKGCIKSV